nr:DUF308 domain-containing protein [Eubacterium sp. 1001713B170207_170306_E7]
MLLEGICLVVICGMTLFVPDVTLSFLVMVIGIYRVAMGVFYLIVGIANRVEYGVSNGFSFGRGIVDILVGAAFLLWPTTIISFFVVLVGIWAIITGIVLLVMGGSSLGVGRAVKIVLGVLLIIFGIFTFMNPVGQAVFFIVFLGIVLGILGFFFIIQSFGMRKSYKELKKLNEGFKDYDVH